MPKIPKPWKKPGFVLVQAQLPQALVKALDHICIDQEINRRDLIHKILEVWLKGYEKGDREVF